jgi:hypothetical protein
MYARFLSTLGLLLVALAMPLYRRSQLTSRTYSSSGAMMSGCGTLALTIAA